MALSVDAACDRLLAAARATRVDVVDLAAAAGRTAAYDLRARDPLPAFPASVMDGYAVRAASVDPGTVLEVAGESAAGHPHAGPLPSGAAVRISTGAALPAGADAVVPQEWTERLDGGACVRLVEVPSDFGPGTFVRAVGSDVPAGAVVVPAGRSLGPGDLALAAAAGHVRLPVRARPQVAILSTGDELHPPGRRPPPGGVVSTNDLTLSLQVREAGGLSSVHPPAADDRHALEAALRRIRETRPDVLVTSGGISVGPHDLVRPVLEGLGARCLFHGLTLKPGRPAAAFDWDGIVVCALPGNPASTFVTFELLVRPLLRAMVGAPPHRRRRRVRLARAVVPERSREHVLRARWTPKGRALPLHTQASGALSSLAGAELLLRIPADPRRTPLPPGCEVEAVELPERWS